MKRFTATEKWSDPWFRKLEPKYKLLWLYLCDTCDNAGMWKIDLDLAEFSIGYKFGTDDLEHINNGKNRVVVASQDYWLITDFVTFQIGHLDCDKLTNLQKSCKVLIQRYLDKGIDIIKLCNATPSLPVANGYIYKGKGKGIGKGKGKGKVNDGENEKMTMDTPFEYAEGNPYTRISANEFNRLLDKAEGQNIPGYGVKMILDYYADWIQGKILEHPQSKDYKNRSPYHNIVRWVFAWWFKEGCRMPVDPKIKNKTYTKFKPEEFDD